MKQFGEDNPSAALPGVNVNTVSLAERKYQTAFPVSADAMDTRARIAHKLNAAVAKATGSKNAHHYTSVATGVGPFA